MFSAFLSGRDFNDHVPAHHGRTVALQDAGRRAVRDLGLSDKSAKHPARELVVIYFGSIILDSMFHFGWQIAKLPAPWDGYAWVILGSFFLTSPIMALTSNFVRGK